MYTTKSTMQAQPIPPITNGHFSYSSPNGLQYDNRPRLSPASLNALFTPKKDQPVTATDGYKLTKPAISAQLHLYGVTRNLARLKVGEARDFFAGLVKSGKLNAPTAEITQLETDLREKYIALKTAQDNAQQAYLDTLDATQAADYSIDLFLMRYFLNPDGTPNREKTPKAIALPGFTNRGMMHAAAERIPGLHTISDGEEPYRVLAIGWDRNDVWRAAAEAAAPGTAMLAEERDEGKVGRMEVHKSFLEALLNSKKGATKGSGKGKKDDEVVVGRYLVECEEIEGQWPDTVEGGIYLKIVKEGDRFVGEFAFGVLEGIMRFRKEGEEPLRDKKSKRGGFREYFEDLEDEDEDEDEDDEEDEFSPSEPEDNEEEDEGFQFYSTSNKRKRTTTTTAKAKKARTSPQTNNNERLKLLFQWRGRETGEGEIQNSKSDKGYIEFDNADCTTFKGVMHSTYCTKAKLRGYKVEGDDGRGINSSWEDFSEKAYEYERVARWG